MPLLRPLRSSGLHRLAAIALYRALLSQSRALPTPNPELLNLIRNRFKQSQYVNSIKRLKLSFEAGYEAIDVLDRAVAGDVSSQEYVEQLVRLAPERAREPKPMPVVKVKKGLNMEKSGQGDFGDEAEKRSILDRPIPLEKLKGKRHVPILFNANRIPVLRIQKPQPESLSRYIHKRVLQRQKWLDEKARLQVEQKVAVLEDEWDDLMGDLLGDSEELVEHTSVLGEEPDYEASWEDTVSLAVWDVHARLIGEKEKNRIVAKRMQEVVDREKALFEQERAERRANVQMDVEEVRRLDFIDDIMPEDERMPEQESVVKRQTSLVMQSDIQSRLRRKKNLEDKRKSSTPLLNNKYTTRIRNRGQEDINDPPTAFGLPQPKARIQRRRAIPKAVAPKTIAQGYRAPRQRAPEIGTQLLVLHIGPQLQLVTLHSNLLPEAVKFYIGARQVGEWFFALPEVDHGQFIIYRNWLYTKQFHTISADEDVVEDGDGDEVVADSEWVELAHCYILGQTIHDEHFTNASISAIIEKMVDTDCHPTGLASDVYMYTDPSSKLRKLIVDVHVWRGLGWWIREPHDDARGPSEFLQDVARDCTAAGGSLWADDVEMPWESDLCGKYHVHEVTERCIEVYRSE